MASNYYTRGTVDGPVRMKRHEKQGRKPKDPEIKKVYVTIMATKQGKKKIKENAKSHNMSMSAWLELAGCLYSI